MKRGFQFSSHPVSAYLVYTGEAPISIVGVCRYSKVAQALAKEKNAKIYFMDSANSMSGLNRKYRTKQIAPFGHTFVSYNYEAGQIEYAITYVYKKEAFNRIYSLENSIKSMNKRQNLNLDIELMESDDGNTASLYVDGKVYASVHKSKVYARKQYESYGAESNNGKIFVYQGYRDTIDKFHGKFDTLEEAENHIYEDLVKDVQGFLDEMQQMRENGEKITQDALRSEKDLLNRDWKGEFKKVSQTPKGSIQQSGSWLWNNTSPPMYQGYSQRYEDANGNYPYIVFDPSFTPPSTEMKAESYGADETPICECGIYLTGNPRYIEQECLDCGKKSHQKCGDDRKWYVNCAFCKSGNVQTTNLEEWKKLNGYGAETFNVEFDDWAKQEMLTHGEDISFKEWAQDESEKHGDMDLEDWAEHEEESHDERYGAERYWDKDTDSYREIYKHSIEVREFPKSSSVYQNGKLVKQYKGQGHFTNATAYAQKLENDYVPKSFFAEGDGENMTSKLKSPYVIGAFAIGLGIPYITSFLNSKKDK